MPLAFLDEFRSFGSKSKSTDFGAFYRYWGLLEGFTGTKAEMGKNMVAEKKYP